MIQQFDLFLIFFHLNPTPPLPSLSLLPSTTFTTRNTMAWEVKIAWAMKAPARQRRKRCHLSIIVLCFMHQFKGRLGSGLLNLKISDDTAKVWSTMGTSLPENLEQLLQPKKLSSLARCWQSESMLKASNEDMSHSVVLFSLSSYEFLSLL